MMGGELERGRIVRWAMLFVAGEEANSLAALHNVQRLREAAPDCDLHLEVVNVLEQYQRALDLNVLVTPCLLLVEPKPRVMVVGTLNDVEKVRSALRMDRGESV
jgi:KaiB domain